MTYRSLARRLSRMREVGERGIGGDTGWGKVLDMIGKGKWSRTISFYTTICPAFVDDSTKWQRVVWAH